MTLATVAIDPDHDHDSEVHQANSTFTWPGCESGIRVQSAISGLMAPIPKTELCPKHPNSLGKAERIQRRHVRPREIAQTLKFEGLKEIP